MYLADLHTHSRRSPDGAASMTQMAQAAAAAGLDEICFTDHVEPTVFGTALPRTDPYDWAALSADFSAAQAAMKGTGLTLRLGIELGDAHWDLPGVRRLLQGAPELDFIIGSAHLIPRPRGGEDLYRFAPEDAAAAQSSLEDYLAQVRRLVQWGGFCVLGHLTLPVRFLGEMRGFPVSFDPYEPQIRDIFKALLEKGLGIELNMNRGKTPPAG